MEMVGLYKRLLLDWRETHRIPRGSYRGMSLSVGEGSEPIQLEICTIDMHISHGIRLISWSRSPSYL